MNCLILSLTGKQFSFTCLRTDGVSFRKHKYLQWSNIYNERVTSSLIQLHWLPCCAQSYTQCTQADVRRTCRKQYTLSAAQQHVLDYARQCQQTTSFHDYVRSSVNAPSTPVQLRGILFQYTCEKRWTFIVLKYLLRFTLLV